MCENLKLKGLSIALCLAVFVGACSEAHETMDYGALSDEDSFSSVEAVPLHKAQSADITKNKVTCSGKDKKQICVYICHRPPGNPTNSRTLVLPLKATLAHLHHGNSTHPDTIGHCTDSTDEPTDSSPDNPADDDTPSDGDIPNDNDTPSDDETPDDPADDGAPNDGGEISIPPWCRVEVDQNCDGFDDESGESLL